MTSRALPMDLPESLISMGRYWATTADLESMTGQRGATLRTTLARLAKQGRLFSPARGFYVPVPPEFRGWRVVPAEWFIDALMKHLQRAHYVGFLNAAAMHGASHQSPTTFRVVTDRDLADRDFERLRLRFTVSSLVSEFPVERRIVPTGFVTIATPETTLVDLAWRPDLGGGIGNVATVLRELNDVDTQLMARIATMRRRSTVRRLGWLIEQFRPDLDPYWLQIVAKPDEGEPSLLVPGHRRGAVDSRWGLRVNAEVEPDI